jgi:hypothetical protein
MIGPLIFGIALVVLTLTQRDFLRGLGWRPQNGLDWPSGLALSRYGGIMTLTFLLAGATMSIFALALREKLAENRLARLGTGLLFVAGLALAGLAFPTDPTLRTTPATWHGIFHDSFFVLLGLTLLPAMLLLGAAFRRDTRWLDLSTYSFVTVALLVPTFWIKGAAFYFFLAVVLVWSEIIAWRLFLLAREGA